MRWPEAEFEAADAIADFLLSPGRLVRDRDDDGTRARHVV
jgi:hypothetical protein